MNGLTTSLLDDESSEGSEETEEQEVFTYGRVLARRLSKYLWYYPRRDIPLGPHDVSLKRAWDHYEKFALGRYIDPFSVGKNPDEIWDKAAPGEYENPTHLYPISCPEYQLAGFGIGPSLYFHSLRLLGGVLFGAFLINLPLYFFYRSDEYSDAQEDVSFTLKGSAICTRQVWAPCIDCAGHFPSRSDRYAEAVTDSSLGFVRINDCQVNFKYTIYSLVAFVFVLIYISRIRKIEKEEIVKRDEKQETASDYSIRIKNPPKDANRPEEWKAFINKVCPPAHVTVVTIKVDNDELLRKLKAKKQLLLEIDYALPQGLKFDESKIEELMREIPPLPCWKRPFVKSADYLLEEYRSLDQYIRQQALNVFDVTTVFITLETEMNQRAVLEKLSTGPLAVWRQDKTAVPSDCLFRGERVLRVVEPAEPWAMRWHNLNTPYKTQYLQRIFTFILSLIIISFGAQVIAYCAHNIEGSFLGYTASAAMITILNQLTPNIVGVLMNYEHHSNDGSRQASLFIKICLFRWINTSVVLFSIKAFETTLEPLSLIQLVYSLFLTEITTTPILQLSDYMGNFKRHFVAPRAPDRRRLMQCFAGTDYSLAERYTAMNKMVFLSFFYGLLFPFGFFLGAVSLFVHYWVDKVCLLRIWNQGPPVGEEIININAKFNGIAMVFYIVMAFLGVAQFPYDNACVYDGNDAMDALNNYIGSYLIKDGQDETFTVNISQNDIIYNFCSQNLIDIPDIEFPLKWMTPNQRFFTKIFAFSAVASVLFAILYTLFNALESIVSFFRFQKYEAKGSCGTRRFSTLDEAAYIPQMKIPGYVFPSLCCKMTNDVPKDFIGWEHSDENFKIQNLMDEIPTAEVHGSDGCIARALNFSLVKYWPSPDTEKDDVILKQALFGPNWELKRLLDD